MLDFHAIKIIGKHRQLELEQEAKIYRLIKESKEKKKEKKQDIKSYNLINTILNIRPGARLNTWLNGKLNAI
ncbi:MAG: hypothetical protein KAJ62_03730, partial [Desulfobacteraceae bacterium]|nr:hypothetical protein [Desulfobacteraceae bacterium]